MLKTVKQRGIFVTPNIPGYDLGTTWGRSQAAGLGSNITARIISTGGPWMGEEVVLNVGLLDGLLGVAGMICLIVSLSGSATRKFPAFSTAPES